MLADEREAHGNFDRRGSSGARVSVRIEEEAKQANDSPDNDKLAYGLDRYAWNQGYNAKYDFRP